MEAQKKQQLEYHTAEVYRTGTPDEPDERNPLVAWLNNCRLSKMEMIGAALVGKSVLSVRDGEGRETHYLSSQGANVTVTDLCAVDVQLARLRDPALHCLCMDAESLAFRKRSFDWVIVREGLHHAFFRLRLLDAGCHAGLWSSGWGLLPFSIAEKGAALETNSV